MYRRDILQLLTAKHQVSVRRYTRVFDVVRSCLCTPPVHDCMSLRSVVVSMWVAVVVVTASDKIALKRPAWHPIIRSAANTPRFSHTLSLSSPLLHYCSSYDMPGCTDSITYNSNAAMHNKTQLWLTYQAAPIQEWTHVVLDQPSLRTSHSGSLALQYSVTVYIEWVAAHSIMYIRQSEQSVYVYDVTELGTSCETS